MQYVYIATIGLHVMAGVFWAGTTITLARDPEIKAERFIQPQMGSAGVVFLTGALLWYFFHGAYFGSMEMVLALGILAVELSLYGVAVHRALDRGDHTTPLALALAGVLIGIAGSYLWQHVFVREMSA